MKPYTLFMVEAWPVYKTSSESTIPMAFSTNGFHLFSARKVSTASGANVYGGPAYRILFSNEGFELRLFRAS
jgi:hypothetical protein